MDPTEQNRKAWDEIHRRRAESMSGQLGIPDGIRELLPDVDGKHVLHLQCATGESTAELVELGALVSAVDISTEALEVARERAPDVAYIHADVHDLPLEVRGAGSTSSTRAAASSSGSTTSTHGRAESPLRSSRGACCSSTTASRDQIRRPARALA